MSRKAHTLKWHWDYRLNEFRASKGGNHFAVGFDPDEGAYAFVCYKGENMWRKLLTKRLQSIREGFMLCEHYAEIQTWKHDNTLRRINNVK